jgi:hypothetical protein
MLFSHVIYSPWIGQCEVWISRVQLAGQSLQVRMQQTFTNSEAHVRVGLLKKKK